jgi:sec-independent protein translocase protein TatA
MPFGLKPFELIVILVIILLLFGVGRISKLGGELGSGIKAFKEGLTGKKAKSDEEKTEAEKEVNTEDQEKKL